MREGASWYAGTLDAIRQNRYLLERSSARHILVLDGGSIYRMDYAEMIRAHVDLGADISLALRSTESPGLSGPILLMDKEERISDMSEAGDNEIDDSPDVALQTGLTTMGVCLFDKKVLLAELDCAEASAAESRDVMGV